MNLPEVGSILPNGSEVVGIKPATSTDGQGAPVLCYCPWSVYDPFVVWSLYTDDSGKYVTLQGDYHNEEEQARKAFDERN